MTRNELFEKLKPMAESLQNNLTSKQYAFNKNKNIIEECQLNGINSKFIVEAINSHLTKIEKITLGHFKTLLARSKKKSETTVKERAAPCSACQCAEKGAEIRILIIPDNL